MAESTLNPKQERFCQEYIVDLNGTQAAIRAGYSAKTANPQAAQLLAKLSIQKRIADLQAKKSKALSLKAEDTLKAIAEIAFSDEEDIRTTDRLKALDMLAKHQALYVNENKQGDMVQIVVNKPAK